LDADGTRQKFEYVCIEAHDTFAQVVLCGRRGQTSESVQVDLQPIAYVQRQLYSSDQDGSLIAVGKSDLVLYRQPRRHIVSS
jgi:hypothetical protein